MGTAAARPRSLADEGPAKINKKIDEPPPPVYLLNLRPTYPPARCLLAVALLGCCCELLRTHEHLLLAVLLGWLFGLVE
jgi:hypothetical protein